MDSADTPSSEPRPDPQVASWVRDMLASGIEQPAAADAGAASVPGAGELFDTDPARLAAQPPEPIMADYGDRLEHRPATEAEGNERVRGLRNILEWVAVLGGAFIVALVIKTFLLQAFFIPSASMESTLIKDDRILVNKLSYRLHDVNHGDIIVFERPPSEPVSEVKDLIKRVIGVAGDTVEARNGSLFLNGQLVIEPYLDDDIFTSDFRPVTVPSDHLFVMGDNRGDSRDSRSFGPIDEDLVVGRAFVRVWPYDRLGLL